MTDRLGRVPHPSFHKEPEELVIMINLESVENGAEPKKPCIRVFEASEQLG